MFKLVMHFHHSSILYPHITYLRSQVVPAITTFCSPVNREMASFSIMECIHSAVYNTLDQRSIFAGIQP